MNLMPVRSIPRSAPCRLGQPKRLPQWQRLLGVRLLGVRLLGVRLLGMSLTASLSSSLLSSLVLAARPSLALPPPEDQPEEVLRTEIILEARSPQDGRPITAAEYARLQAELEAQNQPTGTVAPEIRRVIFLLRVRKVLRTILPFLP
jgi:hypothetical protein